MLQSLRHILLLLAAAIVAYLPRPKVEAGVNLLSGKNDAGEERTQAEQSAEAAKPREIISFLKPNITISLIDDQSAYERSAILPQVQPLCSSSCAPMHPSGKPFCVQSSTTHA